MGMGIELPTEAERMGEETGEVEAAEAVAEGVVVVEGVAELGAKVEALERQDTVLFIEIDSTSGTVRTDGGPCCVYCDTGLQK